MTSLVDLGPVFGRVERDGREQLRTQYILEGVDSVCTRAIIITRGKLVFDGTPQELKERSPSGRLDEVFREITTAAEPVRG